MCKEREEVGGGKIEKGKEEKEEAKGRRKRMERGRGRKGGLRKVKCNECGCTTVRGQNTQTRKYTYN